MPDVTGLPTYLFVLPWSIDNPGGVDQVVINLHRCFAEGGRYEPRLLVASWEHRSPVTSSGPQVPATRLRLRSPLSGRSTIASLLKWALALPRELDSIARLLRAQRVAVVNVHFPSLSALQIIATRRMLLPQVRVILSFHGMDLANASATNGLERRLWRRLLRSADACVGCSRALTSAIRQIEPDTKLATTIHNGLDIDHLMSARNSNAALPEWLAHGPIILSVATLEHKKGLDTLIRAFRLVRERCSVDPVLALVGPDHGAGAELRQLAATLGVAGSVAFCGEVSHADLHAYYARATLFCLTSRAEPFGIVLLEAGAFRLPVVATAVGGIQEILDHDGTGRLVPVDDPQALAAAMLDLLQSPHERARLGNALFEHVRRNFSWGHAYRQYLDLAARLQQEAYHRP